MMRKLNFLITLLFLLILGPNAQSQDYRILPEKLQGITTGLKLNHFPNPVYPEVNTDGDAKYVWKHNTSFSTEMEGLEVVEAGSFIWIGSGWKKNMYFKKKDILKFFGMTSKHIQKGKVYTFEDNYRFGDVLFGGDALWYIIAKNEDGQLFKAYGIVETEAKFKN